MSTKYHKWYKYLLSKYSMSLSPWQVFFFLLLFFSGQTLQSFAGTGKDLLRSISWGSQARREWLYLELNLLFRESITIVYKLHYYIKGDGVGGLSLSFSLSLLSSSDYLTQSVLVVIFDIYIFSFLIFLLEHLSVSLLELASFLEDCLGDQTSLSSPPSFCLCSFVLHLS